MFFCEHFFHNVFHSYISLVSQNAALCGTGLNYWILKYFHRDDPWVTLLKNSSRNFDVRKHGSGDWGLLTQCSPEEITVKPVLETTCIKTPPALRNHCSSLPFSKQALVFTCLQFKL